MASSTPPPGEACDTSGPSPTCTAECLGTTCGDSVINVAAGEQCDDGGDSVTCDDDCTAAVCGDGKVNMPRVESCVTTVRRESVVQRRLHTGGLPRWEVEYDVRRGVRRWRCERDGPRAMRAGCAAPRSCGNGTVETGEECDESTATAQLRCQLHASRACGDGTFNAAAAEQCDGGGETGACDTDCTNAICQDGMYNPSAGEQCDDGMETAGVRCRLHLRGLRRWAEERLRGRAVRRCRRELDLQR